LADRSSISVFSSAFDADCLFGPVESRFAEIPATGLIVQSFVYA